MPAPLFYLAKRKRVFQTLIPEMLGRNSNANGLTRGRGLNCLLRTSFSENLREKEMAV